MIKLLTSAQMKICDERTIKNGIPSKDLMERAARALVDLLTGSDPRIRPDTRKIGFLCGTGHNGGDGLAAARFMHKSGFDVFATIVRRDGCTDSLQPSDCCDETFVQYGLAKKAGVPFSQDPLNCHPTLWVDAIIGTGLERELSDGLKHLIREIEKKDVPVIAVDIPTGISSDLGRVMGSALHAEATLCIQNMKRGHLLFPGSDYCGLLSVCDIGISDQVIKDCDSLVCPDPDFFKPYLPARPLDSNKGTFGRLLCVCGSVGMAGAAILAAKAAYRSGVGLVEILSVGENREVIQSSLPEAVFTEWNSNWETVLPQSTTKADAVLIGCGLDKSKQSLKIMTEVLSKLKPGCPLILDADALNLLALNPILWDFLPNHTVLTPHPGEAARLLSSTVSDIVSDPVGAAESIVSKKDVVCVLKGARTIVASRNAKFLLSAGSPALAKAGTGDVLAGCIASLLCQNAERKQKHEFELAALGVMLHGRAGGLASERYGSRGLLASDVADQLGIALSEMGN